MEETFLFPKYEEKLGKGALTANYEQHEEFVPQMNQLEELLKAMQAGDVPYDGNLIVEKVHAFSDTMVQHLGDVGP
jgi:hemerythrin-like domain-containing protein